MGAKLSFELDSGKILAKLHRGACQTREEQDKVLFFNTGIINDANLKPEEVDKSKINFDMDNNEYELGVVLTKDVVLQLEQAVDDMNKANAAALSEESIGKFVAELDQYLEREKKEFKAVSEKEWEEFCEKYNKKCGSKLEVAEFKEKVLEVYAKIHKEKDNRADTDKKPEAEKQDNKEKKPSEEKPQEDKNTPITQNPDQAKAVNEDYTQMDPNIPGSVPLADLVKAMTTADDKEFARLEKNAKGDAAKAIEKNHDAVKKFMEQRINFATTYLQDYMRTFAGEDESKKITGQDVSVTYLPADAMDPYKINSYKKYKYQIPALTDEQVRQEKIKQLQDAEKKGKAEFSYANMCFKIAYTLDLGK